MGKTNVASEGHFERLRGINKQGAEASKLPRPPCSKTCPGGYTEPSPRPPARGSLEVFQHTHRNSLVSCQIAGDVARGDGDI